MRTPSTDIFGPVEENNDENIEEEEEKQEDTNSSEEEGEANDDDEPDPWSPLRQKIGEDFKGTYLKEVQQFLDRGKSQTLCRKCRFQRPVTCK